MNNQLEQIVGVFLDYMNARRKADEEFKSALMNLIAVTLSEKPFLSLTWLETYGGRMGKFQYTTLDKNKDSDNFQRCLNILQRNNASIDKPFSEQDWTHRYWLWKERQNTIYRKQN